jgi:16S rRNA (cytidine1402-2'-O)-methyltransferase
MADAFGGDRAAAVCRELTKTYEEVRRGTLAELAAWATGDVRGEITVVVGGAAPRPADLAAAVHEVEGLVTGGLRLKDAVSEVAARSSLAKRELYDAVLATRDQPV